jgi:hypothetical protein
MAAPTLFSPQSLTPRGWGRPNSCEVCDVAKKHRSVDYLHHADRAHTADDLEFRHGAAGAGNCKVSACRQFAALRRQLVQTKPKVQSLE